ncbi:MAG: amidophosphoribosyltransferase [Candidatus Mycalebacterium zealandia]|nr:MAG: amidophosphoribosyltransferase [Candidatus Mycalebacterium zealandia]
MMSQLKEECGVFGIFNHAEASNLAYLGLHSLQHRGQESAGITTSDGKRLHRKRAMGLVADIFDEESLKKLSGTTAIGHVRYSTSGSSTLNNIQPIVITRAGAEMAIAHNGNLTNALTLRHRLENEGAIFQSTADTEVVVHLMARSPKQDLAGRIIYALSLCKGAYSMVFLDSNKLVAARDPYGFRPLVLGKLGDGCHVVASETCAFDLIEAQYVREIEPGEIVIIDEEGIQSLKPFPKKPPATCVFEYIYFSRPDSSMNGRSTYLVRKELGKRLAVEHPAKADIVIAVPDSGVPAAMGYSEQLGIPLEMGFLRSHYVGRTFIEPEQSIRNFGVKLKLSAVREVIKNKRVVVVDDSIVRGTTSRKIVKMLKGAKAKEVHVRICAPPMKFSCYYGIDTPNKDKLIANSLDIEEIKKYITADSLGYLSRDGIDIAIQNYSPFNTKKEGYCYACFTGDYKVEIDDLKLSPTQMNLFPE